MEKKSIKKSLKSVWHIIILTAFCIPVKSQCVPDTLYRTDTICVGDSAYLGYGWRKYYDTYVDTFTNASSCDSIVYTDLIVNGYAPYNSGCVVWNGDFENWVSGYQACDSTDSTRLSFPESTLPLADLFNMFGSIPCIYQPYVQHSNNAYSGNSAVKIRSDTSSRYFNNSGALIMFGYCTAQPKELRGYFQFNGTSLDTLYIGIGAEDEDSTFNFFNDPSDYEAWGESVFTGSTSGYTPFSIELDFQNNRPVDSIAIIIWTNGPSASIEALVDHLFIVGQDATTDIKICQGDSVLIAGRYESNAGYYLDTNLSSTGCDSIVEYELIKVLAYQEMDSLNICLGDSVFLGRKWQKSNGLYIDSLTSSVGCDSVISVSLNVINSYTSVLNPTICPKEEYITPSGKKISQSVNGYLDTLSSANGCDSLFIINVTQVFIDTNTLIDSNVTEVKASQTNATYQWLDCTNNLAPIVGATSQSYSITTQQGSVAVEITKDMCKDTSGCKFWIIGGITENTNNLFNIYPNPANNYIYVETTINVIRISFYNINGKLIYAQNGERKTRTQLDVSDLERGIYFLKMESEFGTYSKKVVLK